MSEVSIKDYLGKGNVSKAFSGVDDGSIVEKAHVKAHTRKTAHGMVQVKDHTDSRTTGKNQSGPGYGEVTTKVGDEEYDKIGLTKFKKFGNDDLVDDLEKLVNTAFPEKKFGSFASWIIDSSQDLAYDSPNATIKDAATRFVDQNPSDTDDTEEIYNNVAAAFKIKR